MRTKQPKDDAQGRGEIDGVVRDAVLTHAGKERRKGESCHEGLVQYKAQSV